MRTATEGRIAFAAAAIGGFTQRPFPYRRRMAGSLGSQQAPSAAKMKRKKAACKSECCREEHHRASPSAPAAQTPPTHTQGLADKFDLLKVAASPPSFVTDEDAAQEILFVDKIDKLNVILKDDVQLAVWRQSSLPKFIKAISDISIEPQNLPSFNGMIPTYPGMVAEVLKKYLYVPYPLRSHEGRKRVLDEEGVDELVEHIDGLAQSFASIVKESGLVGGKDEVPFVNVKLSVVGDDGCRFWHQDYVPFRMCTTFRGACTEWVPPAYSKATLEHREQDSNHAQSLTHYDVALFKGRGGVDSDVESGDEEELYDHPGIVHRSPRTSGSGIYRLLLVIDLPQEGWHF